MYEVILTIIVNLLAFVTPVSVVPGTQNLETQQSTINQHVYKVRASGCALGHEFALTGFLLPEEGGIITALHGVLGCSNIRAFTNQGTVFRNLELSRVDLKNDVALLTSPELSDAIAAEPESGFVASQDETATIRVIGFPFDLQESIETKAIRIEDSKALVNLIPPAELEAFSVCGSPSLASIVFSLEGTIRPGESGAPILNDRNEVIGVGMGGLNEGSSDIVWAARWQAVNLVPRSMVQAELEERAPNSDLCITNRFSLDPESREPLQLLDSDQEREALRQRVRELVSEVQEYDVADSCRHQDDNCDLSFGGSPRGTCFHYHGFEPS